MYLFGNQFWNLRNQTRKNTFIYGVNLYCRIVVKTCNFTIISWSFGARSAWNRWKPFFYVCMYDIYVCQTFLLGCMQSVNGSGRQNIVRNEKSIVLPSFIYIKTTKRMMETFTCLKWLSQISNTNDKRQTNKQTNAQKTPICYPNRARRFYAVLPSASDVGLLQTQGHQSRPSFLS